MKRHFPIFLVCLALGAVPALGQGIPALSFEIKKPEHLENKKLGSEKTGEKKFTLPRHVIQNTVTHFNWFFNANEKLKSILEQAKMAHKDDYTQLLSFYNYSLDQTARDTAELDSIIIKTNSGILLHDLRNDWIDNLYLLMGKAFYYSKQFDTALLSFQYINYAFAPKEKDGYDKTIGSNESEGGNAFSISTPESRNPLNAITGRPPSRNESFLWLIRTYIAKGEFPEAAGLIETLKEDPNFPKRLTNALYEMQALWFYEQKNYDSAAVYLEKALPAAANQEERARWEYLAGQLYALTKDLDKAAELFEDAAQHTLNPVLEVYARLNAIRQHPANEQAISENITALVRMARREKYVNYRDIIYYSAAQMELERNQVPAAKALLLLSTGSSSNLSLDRTQKSRSFLLLADLSFEDGSFSDAKNFYDSVQNKELIKDQQAFDQRKAVLAKLAQNDLIIQRQDSVQKIARMPEAEREALLKKMVRKIRKEQGLKEEETTFIPGSGAVSPTSTTAPTELFDNAAKGEWYFYNTSLKSKGFTEFRSKWGNRPNIDNWRRASAVTKSIQLPSADLKPVEAKAQVTGNEPKGITLASLLKGIPLSTEQLLLSNDSIREAQFAIGKILMEGLEEYDRAIKQLEEYRDKYPASTHEADALASLYFGYTKTGDMAKAAAVKQLLESRFKDSEFEKKTRPPAKDATAATGEADMTRRYEKIYTLFIEGNFTEALSEKKQADSLYQKNYWTPQLLYIQALYYIRQRMDDTAKAVLNDLIKLYPKHLLAGKAKTLVEVLGRRAEIELYLTQLKVDRPKEEILYEPAPVRIETVIVKKEPAAVAAQAAAEKSAADSTQQPVQNAPKENIVNNPPPAQQPVAPAINPAPASDSATKPPAAVAERKENAPPAPVEPSTPKPTPAPVQQPVTAATKDLSVKPERNSFVAEPEAAHLVMIVLDKVEGIYVNEAKNAFNRWNQQNYYDKPLEINSEPPTADNTRLIFLKPFTNAAEALAYMEKVRKVAESEIVPWLPAEKYSFGVISEKNREVLLNGHTIAEYKNFLKTAYPGKF